MNMLFINNFFIGFMISEIPKELIIRHFPYSVTFPYISLNIEL